MSDPSQSQPYESLQALNEHMCTIARDLGGTARSPFDGDDWSHVLTVLQDIALGVATCAASIGNDRAERDRAAADGAGVARDEDDL